MDIWFFTKLAQYYECDKDYVVNIEILINEGLSEMLQGHFDQRASHLLSSKL